MGVRQSSFLRFVATLNKHHPSIKIKHLLDKQWVDFLDTTIFFCWPRSIYKPKNNTHPHPFQTHRYACAPAQKKLSSETYFQRHCEIANNPLLSYIILPSWPAKKSISILFSSLRRRGYSKRFLRSVKSSTLAGLMPTAATGHHSAEVTDRPGHEVNTRTNGELCIPLITTYTKQYPHLQVEIKKQISDSPGQPPTSLGLQGDFSLQEKQELT